MMGIGTHPEYARMFDSLIVKPNQKGKRWFCSDSEAVAAGFRAAR
jgi:hypothetical protein